MVIKLRQVLAATVALAVLGPVSSAQPEDKYRVKEEQARTGTLFIQHGVTKAPIDVNRDYYELSPEDKAIVHGWYEYIAPGDEPPFPVNGLAPIYKAINKGRNIAPGHGELFLAVTVGPDGKARKVEVFKSPGQDITRYISEVLLLTKYKPAICEGKKCEMQFPLSLSFSQLQ